MQLDSEELADIAILVELTDSNDTSSADYYFLEIHTTTFRVDPQQD